MFRDGIGRRPVVDRLLVLIATPLKAESGRGYAQVMAAELPDLHDAWLEGVSIDFDAGVAEIRVSGVGDIPEVRLTCRAFRRVVIDRDQAWGPSAYIMRVTGGDERLDIEMQSGDHLLFYGPEMKVAAA